MCFAVPAISGAADLARRPVQDVLRELGAEGIDFIYSTDVVPPQLLVEKEPAAHAPLEIAREILAAHGLSLRAVGANTYAVLKDPAAPKSPASAGPGDTTPASELAQIVVTTSRYALAYDEPQVHSVLSQTDVQAVPKLADETLRSVQRLPGSAANGLSAQSHIRGGEYDELLLVLDGLPLYEPFHLKNFFAPVSVFDARAIDSMDVSFGGFTANFGDRMSGVIDISSLTPASDRYTELGTSLFHASALSAGRFAGDRGRWLGSVRRSNMDLLAGAVDSEVGKPEYFDSFGRVSFDVLDGTTLFASALTSRDEVEANTRDETERSDADYRNTYVWGGWEQKWPGAWGSRLMLALTDVDNDRQGSIDEPGHAGALAERRTLRSAMARLDVTHETGRFYTRLGADGREIEARYRYQSSVTFQPGFPLPGDPGETITRDLAPKPDGHQFGGYLTTRARISERWMGEVGLRWDDQTYDDVSGPEQFAPRLNLMFDVSPATRLRAAWGRFWQSQGINELQVEDGIDTFYPAQRADHFIFSLDQSVGSKLDMRIEIFQKDYDRVRPHFENLFDPLTLLPELERDRVKVDPASGRARGVELLLTSTPRGPVLWWFSYAWSRVTDRLGSDDIVRSWDQRHTVNAGWRYSGPRWEFSLADTWHTGWPTTELLPDTGSGVTIGARNAARFDDFNSLDLRVVRKFALEDSTLETFFELSNALTQRNPCCTEYDVTQSGGMEVIDRDTDYWPRLIPSLGVLWAF